MPTFNHIKHIYKKSYKFLTSLLFMAAILLVFASNINAAQAASSLKIKDLKFDNSDNLILIESDGAVSLKKPPEIQDNTTPEEKIINHNEIKKGFLKEPNRAYVDIFNATIMGGTKNYELKNSIFKTIKMSQFQTNPNIVRIVFTYMDENAKTSNFNCLANDKGIIIRYSKSLNKTSKYQIIYSDTDDKERIIFFQNTTGNLVTEPIVPVNNIQDNKDELNKMFDKNNENFLQEKEYKLQSKFYIDSIGQNPNGVTIKGTGFLSLKPALFLDNPSRMVIDFDDTVLARNLRNKTFTIGTPEIDHDGIINPKETIRLGQNSTNVARLVIQGANAKNYRAVISPDLQNIYIAKRSDVINSKITETQSIIKSVNVSKENIKEIFTKLENNEEKKELITSSTIEFNMTEPVAFSTFEENNKLYIDFNNVGSINDNLLNELLKYDKNIQNIKIALDKLRIVFPLDENILNIQVKSSSDAKSLQAVIKKKEMVEEEKKEETISKLKKKEPSISNLYKVVIDAGHGGKDVGATRVGIYEKDITLSIAKIVEKNLQNKGVQTTMTLDRDKTVSLQERCDISNETSPDVFVSIHVNSSVNDAIYGVETHWWKQDSVEYAKIVHSHLEKNYNKWKTKDRGLFKSQFYVINHTEAPAILIEIGFISNADEREAIVTQKRQSEIAKAISEGVMEYLKTRGKEKE